MEPGNMTPEKVLERMLEKDQFSRWLGLEVEDYGLGYCRLHFQVNEIMMNGFSVIHGGILFSAADSAFAFACNSHGRLSVAMECSISFTRPANVGDRLTVEAKEIYLGHKVGVYDIRITNQAGELVAIFKGTSYRTSKTHD
jgi:acyl-CoA thioesterase